MRAVIPIAILVGQEVADNLDDPEGEAEIGADPVDGLPVTDGDQQPFEGVAAVNA